MEGGRYLGGGGPARSAQFEESMVVVSAQVVAAQEDGMGIGSDSHAPSWFWLPAYPRSAFLRLPALNDSDSMCSGGLMPDKEKKVPTYTIRLCKNGTEFKALSNVAERGARPTTVGGTIEENGEKWEVLGVIRHTASELVVDAEPLAGK